MDRILTATLLLLAALPAVALGQIPPGYELIEIDDSPYFDSLVHMNDRGLVVFTRWFDVSDRLTEEIYLYDANMDELTRLTNDHIQDVAPSINNEGVVAWSRGIGPINPGTGQPSLEVVMRLLDGTIDRITDNSAQEFGVTINDGRHLAWSREMGLGCGAGVADIFFFDGQSILPITTDAVSDGVFNQVISLNERDDLTWTRFDFCVNPWESTIRLHADGQTIQLSDPAEVRPQGASINNLRQVAWKFVLRGQSAINLWEDGKVHLFTDWGAAPLLNDRGDMAISRWHNDTSLWQAWLYLDGAFFQLTDDAYPNFPADIGSRGQTVLQSRTFPTTNIRFLKRFAIGDVNCDGGVNAFDIEPFLLALFDSAEYTSEYPNCLRSLADTNEDGQVNAFDIEGFLEILFP